MTDLRRGLASLLVRSGIGEDCEEGRRLLEYAGLLAKWNARVNLTASTEWDALAPLFEEALWAASKYRRGSSVHLDVGSGAGFPALVMRGLLPCMHLTMVEPRTKRAVFLETAAREMRLMHTAVFHGRLDEFLESGQGSGWDVVSWKALKVERRDLARLFELSRPETEFWIFHGAVMPVDDGSLKEMQLLRQESFPKKESWSLSVLRRNVSRET